MGEFRCIRHTENKEVKITINIGIDVHKKKCVATVKSDSRQILGQVTFDNNSQGMNEFICGIKQRYHNDIGAVCESTANYWIRLHDTLEENGIDTILAHPEKTRIIAQAKLKNDKLDSEVLADLLRSDMICESFVPDKYLGGYVI
jgi:transposase